MTKIIIVFSIITMGIAVIMTFVFVVMRFVFNKSYIWGDEAIRILFLSGVFLLVGPVMVQNKNVNLTIVIDGIKNPVIHKIIECFNLILGAFVSAILTYLSFGLFTSVKGQTTASHMFSKQLPYFFMVAGMALMVLFCVLQLIVRLTEKNDASDMNADANALEAR